MSVFKLGCVTSPRGAACLYCVRLFIHDVLRARTYYRPVLVVLPREAEAIKVLRSFHTKYSILHFLSPCPFFTPFILFGFVFVRFYILVFFSFVLHLFLLHRACFFHSNLVFSTFTFLSSTEYIFLFNFLSFCFNVLCYFPFYFSYFYPAFI